MPRFLLFLSVFAIGVLGGCGDSRTPAASASSGPVAAEPATAAAPLLRETLPKGVIAYLRLPNAWGLLGAPDGRALDAARRQPAHVAAIGQLRSAIAAMPELAAGPGAAIRLLFAHSAGPTEIAVLAPSGVAGPDSRVLLSQQLTGVADAAALAALLQASGAAPLQFDAEGYARFERNVLQFDGTSGRLLLLAGGAGADKAALQAVQQGMQGLAAPFAASEARIDQSGQGLFLWVDFAALRPILGMAVAQAGAAGPLLGRVVAACKSLSLGFGTVDGKGRMSLVVEAPEAGFLRYLPREPREFALNTVGLPEYGGSLSLLPAPAELAQFRAALEQDFGADSANEFDRGLKSIETGAGIDPALLLAALGPDLGFFGDAAGDFAVLKVRDRAALQRLLDALGQHPNLRLSSRDEVQMLEIGTSAPAVPPGSAAWLQVFSRVPTVLYWRDEGSYLVFGSLPQALRDRKVLDARQSLADWLRQTHGATYSKAAVQVSGRTRHMHRQFYYAYLSMLHAAAYMSGSSFDPHAFASAAELQLPVEGISGMALETSTDGLALSLSYDASGFDLLGGGNSVLVATAVAGIVAAIALPTYQDYVARAQVSECIAGSGRVKTAIAEYYASEGSYPLAGQFDDHDSGRYCESLTHDGNGVITGTLRGAAPVNARVRGLEFTLHPIDDGSGAIAGWTCDTGAGQQKFLPAACR